MASMNESTAALDPSVRALCATLLTRSDELGAELADLIRRTDVRYRDESVVPADDLVRSCRNNIEMLFSALAGRAVPSTEGPWETGRRRAAQGMPLPTTLRGYRIGGRFVWNVLLRNSDSTAAAREALLRAAEVIWTVVDDFSEALSDAFREAIADQTRHDTQVRTAVLISILDGSLGDGPALWEAAIALGLPHDGDFLVVAAEVRQPGKEPLQRVEQALGGSGVRSAWLLDAHRQIGILSLPLNGSVPAVCGQLAELAEARVGVSRSYADLELTPQALRQARVACLAAAPGTADVIRHEQQPVAVLLSSTPEAGTAFAHDVLGPVLALPYPDRTPLLDTLRTWLTHDASASATAAALYVHRNTVRYRLRRIEALTGLAMTDPTALARLHVALEAARIFGLDRPVDAVLP